MGAASSRAWTVPHSRASAMWPGTPAAGFSFFFFFSGRTTQLGDLSSPTRDRTWALSSESSQS